MSSQDDAVDSSSVLANVHKDNEVSLVNLDENASILLKVFREVTLTPDQLSEVYLH